MTAQRKRQAALDKLFEESRRDWADPEYRKLYEERSGGLDPVELVREIRREMEEKRQRRNRMARERRANRASLARTGAKASLASRNRKGR